jgi:DUF4097 and DUF4098 domain-containing protein YvlB
MKQAEDDTMRRTFAITLALLLSTAAFADDVIRKGFTVADGGTLRLDAGIGDVTIVTGGSGVAIEVVRDADGKRGEERLRGHKIDFRQSGNDVTVASDLDDDWNHRWFNFGGDDYEVKWNIRVPDHYNVEVRTSGGFIRLDEIFGTVDARTSGGSIRTGHLRGESKLKTSGGSINVDGASANLSAHTSGGSIDIGDAAAPIEARTSGGSIRLGRVGGAVVAHTSGGNIQIEEVTGSIDATTSGGSIKARLTKQLTADSRLATSGGGVTVTIANGVNAEIDARASGGGVTSDIPLVVQGKIDANELRGRIGTGGPKLTLRTSGGRIRIVPL